MDSEENRGSSGNFELEENLCVHFGSTFPDGNTECISTGIAPSGLGVSLDLKDAYLHVPIHPQSRRLLGFQVSRQDLRVNKVLPFGLKDSPWVFQG